MVVEIVVVDEVEVVVLVIEDVLEDIGVVPITSPVIVHPSNKILSL